MLANSLSSFDIKALVRGGSDIVFSDLIKTLGTYMGDDVQNTQIFLKEMINMLVHQLGKVNYKDQRSIISMVIDIIKLVDNDDFSINIILSFAYSNDRKQRVLAANLMPTIGKVTDKVEESAIELSLDMIPAVKTAIVCALTESNFQDKTIRTILKNAVNDKNDHVQIQAAQVLSKVAPSMTKEYSYLLKNEPTTATCLHFFVDMVKMNGLSHIYEAFIGILDKFALEATRPFYEMLPYITQDEYRYVKEIALKFPKEQLFLSHIHELFLYVEDKDLVFHFLDLKTSCPWRVREVICWQCIALAHKYKLLLIPYAIKLSNDPVAIVRDQSVELWSALIKEDEKAIHSLIQLVQSGFQQRIVLAKVIGKTGSMYRCRDTVEQLQKDNVETVRYCMESQLRSYKPQPI